MDLDSISKLDVKVLDHMEVAKICPWKLAIEYELEDITRKWEGHQGSLKILELKNKALLLDGGCSSLGLVGPRSGWSHIIKFSLEDVFEENWDTPNELSKNANLGNMHHILPLVGSGEQTGPCCLQGHLILLMKPIGKVDATTFSSRAFPEWFICHESDWEFKPVFTLSIVWSTVFHYVELATNASQCSMHLGSEECLCKSMSILRNAMSVLTKLGGVNPTFESYLAKLWSINGLPCTNILGVFEAFSDHDLYSVLGAHLVVDVADGASNAEMPTDTPLPMPRSGIGGVDACSNL
eukprot:Gb_36517 [translate_table: standard]